MYNKDIKDILLYAMNHGYVGTTFIKFLFLNFINTLNGVEQAYSHVYQLC